MADIHYNDDPDLFWQIVTNKTFDKLQSWDKLPFDGSPKTVAFSLLRQILENQYVILNLLKPKEKTNE